MQTQKRNQVKTGERLNKTVRFNFECKESENESGLKIGVIEGYASTWDLDRGDDRIIRGAFTNTLAKLRETGRPIRMLFGHDYDMLIGGFPIEHAYEDEKGLFVKGEINLEVEKGREAYALAKQGVLTDMSIGFAIPSMDALDFIEEDDRVIRIIKEVDLWETSLVPEPMNPNANITAVKAATDFADLPIGNRSTEWSASNAVDGIREVTESLEAPSDSYKQGFLWYDESKPEDFDSYKLPIADNVEGVLTALPRGIFAAAAALLGARGGVDIPEGDIEKVKQNVEAYYQKMDIPSPFGEENSINLTLVECCQTIKDVEHLLRWAGFTSTSRKMLISLIKSSEHRDDEPNDLNRDGDEVKAELSNMATKLQAFNEQTVTKSLLKKLEESNNG